MSRLEQLQRLHEADPRDADVMYMIAHEHAKAGAWQESVGWFDRCLAVDPAYHYAYFHKARAQYAGGDTPGALSTARVGMTHATRAGNAKASSELSALIDEWEG